MKSVKKLSKTTAVFLVGTFGFISQTISYAAAWNNGVEVGTSVALSYGARSLLVNPAAIAFEKELEGAGLLTSYTYGSTFARQHELSLTTSYSFLGLGYERLYQGEDSFSRYQLGVAYPLTQEIFWGVKFSTTSSSASALSGNSSWDLGVQYRPLSFLSMGLIVSQLNQPTINGIKKPSIYTFGAAFRPRDWVTVAVDFETPSNDFFKSTQYQATVAVQPLSGVTLSSGFQSRNRFQVGLQLDLGRASFFSVVQPSPKDSVKSQSANYTFGIQTALRPQKSWLRPSTELLIHLDETLSEEGREGSFFAKAKPSLLEILDSIRNATSNPSIEKITVKLESFPLGLAAAEELTEALLKARNQSKTVEVFLTTAKTKEYLIASAGSSIYLETSGDVTFLGARTSHYYAKGTLEKLGIEGEFFARGDYKSAPESFTRKESSPKSRDAIQHELKQIDEALSRILLRTRNISKVQWQSWLQHAVFSSEEALKEKIIDKVGSYAEAKNADPGKGTIVPSTRFASRSLSLSDRISVITAQGTILEKKNRLMSISGQTQLTPESLEPLFQKAMTDPRTKAVVLRVSSPGGEVIASEQIAALVEKTQNKKPVIVSMGDMAASGGYFISAPARTIFADSLTFTGSIGVFLGKFNLGGLYQKLDLKKEIWGVGPYPGLDSEHKSWTKAERAIMQRRLDQFYESFVSFVAKSRKISKELAEKAAQGRVWLGEESVNLKIVDSKGGLLDAIESARTQSGLKGDFEIHPLREQMGFIEALSEETVPGVSSDLKSLSLFLDPKLQRELAKIAWIQEHPCLYFEPNL